MTIKSEIHALYYAYQDPLLPWWPKFLLFITLGYALSPIDLIPDFIPIIGYLDDVIIIPALISLSIKSIPSDIMMNARKKAEDEPFQLKKNWFFALLFITLWLTILLSLFIVIL